MADKMNYGDCAVYPIPAVNRLLKETEETIKTDISGDISDLETSLSDDISGLDRRLDTAETKIGTLETITATNNADVNLSESDVIAIVPGENDTWVSYGNFGYCYYYKKGTRVHIHLGLDELSTSSRNDICTLPEGYRPRSLFVGIGQGQTTTTTGSMQIKTSGEVVVYGSTAYFIGDLEFDTFEANA